MYNLYMKIAIILAFIGMMLYGFSDYIFPSKQEAVQMEDLSGTENQDQDTVGDSEIDITTGDSPDPTEIPNVEFVPEPTGVEN